MDGPVNGTVGDPNAGRIPTGGMSKADGEALVARAGEEANPGQHGHNHDHDEHVQPHE